MSFIDIGTLTEHRRNEMEGRVEAFLQKCDLAVNNIEKMKAQAKQLTQKLNCNPSELKDCFLSCMKQLDEYNYFITDFNIAASIFEEKDSCDFTPVQDGPAKILSPLPPGNLNLIDVLTEQVPSSPMTCPNNCKNVKQKKKKVPKDEQTLIEFSSNSSSYESVHRSKKDIVMMKEMEVQCQLIDDTKMVQVKEEATSPVFFESINLPAQSVLQVDHSYPATIVGVDGTSFWVVTDESKQFYDMLIDLNSYYRDHELNLEADHIAKMTYCACYDNHSDGFFRGLLISFPQANDNLYEVYLVDTGNVLTVNVDCIQPLIPRFCNSPPYARCCHLAGIDLLDCTNKELNLKQEELMRTYIGTRCTIEVDDNTSESLGVYVKLSNGEYLHELLVQQGLALLLESPKKRTPSAKKSSNPKLRGPPEIVPELDMDDCPEYEDPVMAVAGYSNRDEAEICKHYKGGPEKTCFKGSRCKKRHVMMHPDGWTLDKVEVLARCRTLPLPTPGSTIKVLVTCVCHFDRLYVQFPTHEEEKGPPGFGVMLPPTTLKALLRDMNSAATRTAYKPLTLTPAPGELVAAIYPMDEQWYRARVLTVSRADQNVQVQYVDYGNVIWVKEDAIRVLDRRYIALPEQAVLCKLAGVMPKGNTSALWAQAKNALAELTQDKELEAIVVSRDYDELTVQLLDAEGYSIADQLAAKNLITLTEFTVEDDSNIRTKVVVP